MCRWRSWWKGLPALVLLLAAALHFGRAPIETELTDRADRLLVAIGESWAHASFKGRDAVLEGEALSEDARVKVRAELGQLFGVRLVEDRTTLLPERRPFTFAAIRDGNKLKLEGYVPSPYARKRIIEAAEKMTPGVALSGAKELVRARGVPAGDFIGVVSFGLDQLAKMQRGRFTLSDDAFSIEGRAPDFTTYDELEVTVRSELPVDFKLARFAVLPPAVSPFMWSAAREPDGVVLDGYIPLGDARRALLDMVRAAVPGAAISDRLRLADGAPPTEGWLKAVSFALSQLGRLPGGKVTLSGTTIIIEGVAPDFAAYDALAGARRAVPEGYTLTRFAVEPPTVAPFVWGVQRTGSGIRLTGYAPSEDAKRLLLDAVRAGFPGVPLSDEIRIAAGGPAAEAWVNATVFGVSQLAKLRAGAVRGKDATLAISGEAVDSAAFATVDAALAGPLPGGFTLMRDVRPPVVSPYVFSLRKDGQGLTLSGFYPDAPAHAALLADAKALLLGAPVNDVSALAQGAPASFSAAVTAALQELARTSAGEARFDDSKLRFTGTVLYPAAIEQIRANLTQALPKSFTLDLGLDIAAQIMAGDNTQCQKAIDDLLTRGSIGFSPAGDAIAPSSRGLLDHVAAAARGCPDALVTIRVEVPGATPTLAGARARAVSDYLAHAGIAADRIVTDGAAAMAQGQPAPALPAGLQLIVR
ncbi:OmpA family protein [Ancylobacter sp. SL191]|uniref:OmpA family protein n=1 Tax=Ancylobacter sp. SL191 TaxID=2995166 RepID=UPI00226D7B21|nr:flagellar motor protein MotB [Ancylobacter sp. SL191]WAC26501.1 flagellar motor protein MotB [Ancylobacter sp. SL191]